MEALRNTSTERFWWCGYFTAACVGRSSFTCIAMTKPTVPDFNSGPSRGLAHWRECEWVRFDILTRVDELCNVYVEALISANDNPSGYCYSSRIIYHTVWNMTDQLKRDQEHWSTLPFNGFSKRVRLSLQYTSTWNRMNMIVKFIVLLLSVWHGSNGSASGQRRSQYGWRRASYMKKDTLKVIIVFQGVTHSSSMHHPPLWEIAYTIVRTFYWKYGHGVSRHTS